ncbi:hypothetical protein U1701_09890 [Sphingomonas sp. PB2P19]|uniref:hypothetical protein n=1 Tax=Sphingomonas rhamnosi TaxID=3096156 RepID=UPI002FC94E10
MEYSSDNAAEALAFIEQSRVKLAAASETPVLRHLVFAGLMGALTASPAVPLPYRFAVFALIALTLPMIIRWDRRRMGMFINGYRAGKTRMVTAAILVTVLPLYILAAWLSAERGVGWAPLPLGLVATGIAYAGSVWWCRVFRREMLAGVA